MRSEVHLIDCMEFMRSCKDKQFDLAVVDPPYGIGASKGIWGSSNKGKITDYGKKQWDKTPPNYAYFEQLIRVSKNQIIFGANHFIENIPDANSSCWIIWDKENTGDFADCELAWTSFYTAVRKFKFRWNGMLQGDMKNKENRIHPTQKPVALYRWLLRNYAKPNDTIFDSHMGSQSSRIACHMEGFDFTGCELDPEYFEQGNQRYEAFLKTYGTPDPTQAIKGQQINLF